MTEVIKDRELEQGPDGNYYCLNAVTLLYEDYDGQNISFYCSPEGLYKTVLDGIRKMAQLDQEIDPNATKEMNVLKKQLAKVVKASVKALLVVYGDKLLTLFYGTTNHPHMPKKYNPKELDVVDWYMAEFTKVFIANMMRKDLVLVGQRVRTFHGQSLISIDEVLTRPISGVSSVVGSTTSETNTAE